MGLVISYNREEFISRANKIHKNKYDYSLSNYKNSRDKIEIICPIHGIFLQMPYNHLQGKGCLYCSRNQRLTIEEFINYANIKHNHKYLYPDKNYINNLTPIGIECKKHGIFMQNPGNHLMGIGCPKCSGNKRLTIDEFIKKANLKHNNLYNYPDNKYKSYDDEIDIECKKHGIFKQVVRNHLTGRGCPICKNSKGEIEIKRILDINKIEYRQQYIFPDLRHKELLKFDFAIFKDNKLLCLIEYNGQQHYIFKKRFHKDINGFNIYQYRDKLKLEYCYKNNIPLFAIKYDENIENEIYKIFNLILNL